jgi:hypothetical protein
MTVLDAANAFLTAKEDLVTAGELLPRTWDEYKNACDLLVKRLGKTRLVDDLRPEDFAALRAHMASRYGPVRLGNEMQRIRSVFKYALESGLITRPVVWLSGTRKTLPSTRARQTEREARKTSTPSPAGWS